MRVCHDPTELADSLEGANRQAGAAFGDERVYLERWLADARHVEVQVVGDGTGRVVTLGDRDCSTQRRNQKVLEESPAPGLPGRVARAHARTRPSSSPRRSSYRSAGTVEFLVDVATDTVAFLEVNARLAGRAHRDRGGLGHRPRRVDDPHRGRRRDRARRRAGAARPCDRGAGLRRESVARPRAERRNAHARVVSRRRPRRHVGRDRHRRHRQLRLAARQGHHARRRRAPRRSIGSAPRWTRRASKASPRNLDLLRAVVASIPTSRDARLSTSLLANVVPAGRAIEVLAGGTLSHRAGPSGPARILVGRRAAERADGRPVVPDREPGRRERRRRRPGSSSPRAGRACCSTPRRRSASRARRASPHIDGAPLPMWEPVDVAAGATLDGRRDRPARSPRRTCSCAAASTCAACSAALPRSRSAASAGTRAARLRTGDVLHLGADDAPAEPATERAVEPPDDHRSTGRSRCWSVRTATQEFLTAADIDDLLRDRLARAPQLRPHRRAPDRAEPGVGARRRRRRRAASVEHPRHRVLRRLDRLHRRRADHPRPRRSEPRRLRVPGGRRRGRPLEARPAAARGPGAVRSREPPATPTRGERRATRGSDARARRSGSAATAAAVCSTRGHPTTAGPRCNGAAAARTTCSSSTGRWCSISSCASGSTRCSSGSRSQAPRGIIDVTPGIRSLQVHFDADAVDHAGDARPCSRRPKPSCRRTDATTVASRTVHLPLSWDDPATREAIHRYMSTVRADAPVVPVEHRVHPAHQRARLRRRREARSSSTRRTSCSDSATCTSARRSRHRLDPRHRLVTTKYNPARTWTPENAVGIGGAYLCIYGMEGPGGYQFVGRTVPVWNRFRRTADFTEPWLLRFFDQLRFFEVGADELLDWRRDVLTGRAELRVEHSTLRLADHLDFVRAHAPEIGEFRTRQQDAFNAERGRWAEAELAAARRRRRRRAQPTSRSRPAPPWSRPASSRACGRSSSKSASASRPATRWSCSRA